MTDQTAHKIERTKAEIAALRHPRSDEDRVVAAMAELEAIRSATEDATTAVFGHVETIETALRALAESVAGDAKARKHLKAIEHAVTAAYESCSFQDITGQRVGKVIGTLSFIENRVSAMIDTWGRDAIEAMPMPEDARDDDAKLLNGPQVDAAQGMTQEEIDKLFD